VDQLSPASALKPEDRHDSWIVITSVAPPTEQVKAWAALPNWRVVVVGAT
jgi:hypothetical protein